VVESGPSPYRPSGPVPRSAAGPAVAPGHVRRRAGRREDRAPGAAPVVAAAAMPTAAPAVFTVTHTPARHRPPRAAGPPLRPRRPSRTAPPPIRSPRRAARRGRAGNVRVTGCVFGCFVRLNDRTAVV